MINRIQHLEITLETYKKNLKVAQEKGWTADIAIIKSFMNELQATINAMREDMELLAVSIFRNRSLDWGKEHSSTETLAESTEEILGVIVSDWSELNSDLRLSLPELRIKWYELYDEALHEYTFHSHDEASKHLKISMVNEMKTKAFMLRDMYMDISALHDETIDQRFSMSDIDPDVIKAAAEMVARSAVAGMEVLARRHTVIVHGESGPDAFFKDLERGLEKVLLSFVDDVIKTDRMVKSESDDAISSEPQ